MPKPIKYKFYKTYYSRDTAEHYAKAFQKAGRKTRITKIRLRLGAYQYNLWVERK